MIKLNENGKTIVEVGSWQDIYERPGFVRGVDAVGLREILGAYSLSPKEPCGLRGCGTPHNRGYIVGLDDGQETIIGSVCGKKHFGLVFTEAKNAYTREANSQIYRENILETQSRAESISEHIDRIESQGGVEAFKQMHRYMTRLFDERTSAALSRRAGLPDGAIVTRRVFLSEEERQASGGDTFATDRVFTISGIRAARDYQQLNPTQLKKLRSELNEFVEADPMSAEFGELRKFDRWAKQIDERLRALEEVVSDCQRFLIRDNLEAINNYKRDIQTI